jgi:hypothetical protein
MMLWGRHSGDGFQSSRWLYSQLLLTGTLVLRAHYSLLSPISALQPSNKCGYRMVTNEGAREKRSDRNPIVRGGRTLYDATIRK